MIHKRIVTHVLEHVTPTPQNGYIPRILKGNSLWAILGVGTGLFLFSQLLHTTGYLSTMASIYPATLVELTNNDRKLQELPPLTVNKTLETAAQLKVRDMVEHSYFAHTSPQGLSPWHWFAKANYKFLYAGENLAVNFSQSSDVEQAWLNSPLHRANVLSPNFTEIGIATSEGYYNGQKTTYIVQLFGAPAKTVQPVVVETIPAKTNISDLKSDTPTVAGESAIATIQSTPSYEEVKNVDPNIAPADPTPGAVYKVSWYERLISRADEYIAFIIEATLIALILALTGLAMREYEKRHLRHMAGGVVVAALLVGMLFVGRIGVFASDQAPLIVQAK